MKLSSFKWIQIATYEKKYITLQMIKLQLVTLFTALLITIFTNVSNPNIQLITWTGKEITSIYPVLTIFFTLLFIYYILKSFNIVDLENINWIPLPIQFLCSYIQNVMLILYTSGSIQSYFIPLFFLKDQFRIFPGIDMIIKPSLELKKLKLKQLIENCDIPNLFQKMNNSQLDYIIVQSNNFKELTAHVNSTVEEYKMIAAQLNDVAKKASTVPQETWGTWLYANSGTIMFIGIPIIVLLLYHNIPSKMLNYVFGNTQETMAEIQKGVTNNTSVLSSLNKTSVDVRKDLTDLGNTAVAHAESITQLDNSLQEHASLCMSNTQNTKSALELISQQLRNINSTVTLHDTNIKALGVDADKALRLAINLIQQCKILQDEISNNKIEIIMMMAGLTQQDFVLLKSLVDTKHMNTTYIKILGEMIQQHVSSVPNKKM